MRRVTVIRLGGMMTVALFASTTTWADVPRLISYQGKLRDASGMAVDGTAELRFRLYSQSSGGSPTFSETHTGVSVAQGLFSVQIGSQTGGGAPDSVLAPATVYLGIDVNDTGEMSPRTRLVTTPYGVKAKSSEQLVRPDTMTSAVTVDSGGTVALLGPLSATSSVGSLGQVLTSQGGGGPPAWAAVGGGFNPFFPDGFDGMTPIVQSLSSAYAVPAGKNLYITGMGGGSGRVYIGGNTIGRVGRYLEMPAIAGAGQQVTAENSSTRINGFLVNAGVTAVNRSGLNASPYVVPAGQTLFITVVDTNFNLSNIQVGGVVFVDSPPNPDPVIAVPLMVPTGQTVSSGNNDMTFNGYLRNN